MKYEITEYKCKLVKDRKRKVAATHVPGQEQAEQVFMALLAGLPHEEIWIVGLTGTNEIRCAVKISQGGLHGAGLRASDILRAALLTGCSAFIMSHNHPSGDPRPSFEDGEVTRAVRDGANAIGLTLLDHIIVCPEKKRAFSFLSTGAL
jgi:DNA repair protein RadC